jgi:hypothetical protein
VSSYDAHHFRIEWLPDGNTQRTKTAKTVTELITCYYRYKKKNRILCKGEKPDFIPANKIYTQKEWRSHIRQSKRKNPILEGYKYLQYLENTPNSTYRDVAEKFNISKARVSQMIALVIKLPQEIIDYLTNKDEKPDLCYFTERKLRPLTLLESNEAKIEKFNEMKNVLVD